MVLNATFNNISVISWRSVLVLEETGVPATKLSILQITQITMQYSILFITNDVNVKFSAHNAFLE
jgi:hypothetical protein